MNIVNIEHKVKELIADQLAVLPEKVTDDATLEQLGADSLDRMELVMAFEEHFEIEIPDEDAEKIATVRQAIDYVTSRRQ